jgi:beta-glucuronidase
MIKNKVIAGLLFLASFAGAGMAQTAPGSDPLIQHVYNRKHIVLNSYWNYIADPLETGYYDYRRRPSSDGFFKDHDVDNINAFKEYDFDSSPVMGIPGDWNTQSDKLFLYEGTLWFKREFVYEPGDNTVYLYFGAANYDAKVYLNGQKAGEHEGGYTPFNFNVTPLLRKGKNKLIVKVDNKRRTDAVPTNNFDWFNYGGITRDVMLVELPRTFIQSYSIQLKKDDGKLIAARIQLAGERKAQQVRLQIPELKVDRLLQTGAEGVASVEIPADPQRWSPQDPKLYDVRISSETDEVSDAIGFRTIETRGREILLNGEPVFLKGVSIHEEAPFRNGRIYKEEEDRILLEWAKELGCNYVRLAHYPHNEQMVRLAERMGLMVWSEIPVYWTIQWENQAVYDNALNQLDEMMERDQNRANIIIWSIANETPHSDARDRFLSSLAAYARRKDNTRLISIAMERKDKSKVVLSVNDNMSRYVDVISFNQYVGWYDGTSEKIDRVKWEIDYEKPVIISEFGAEAVAGLHGDSTQLWTEEYQAALYRKTLRMIDERMPLVSGISPWVLKDFRSSRRLLPNVQDGFNRKGLVSDRGERKLAFRVLKEWYGGK